MLRELKETLNHIWNRLRRTESWIYGMSQMPLIIEEGTEGIWRYRKWSNGVAECWGGYATTYTNTNTWGGGKYRNLGAVNFPTNLFKIKPIITTSAHKPSGSGMPFFSALNITTTSFDGYIYDDNTGSTGYTVEILVHAIGQWETTIKNTPENLINYLYDNHAWDYNYLDNRPKINGQVVSGNKTLADYGFTGEIANDKIGYTTVAPTEDNPDTGSLKVVLLSEEPATKYNGWLYLIEEQV